MALWRVEVFCDKTKDLKHEGDYPATDYSQALRIAGKFFEHYGINSFVIVISNPDGHQVVELRDPKIN